MLAKKKIHWNVWSNWVYIEQFLKHRYEYAISIFEKKKFWNNCYGLCLSVALSIIF